MKLDLERYVPGLLSWVANKMTSSASQLYHDRFDISVTDWRVLSYFEIFPWSTASQACLLMGLDKASASRSIRLLLDSGWLKSRPDGLRKVQYATNVAGKHLYEKVYEVAMARQEALLTSFSAAERALLIEFLHRLLQNLDLVKDVGFIEKG